MRTGLRLKSKGFTIVELLVVIVIIGVLASVSLISYTGISQRAVSAILQSDLSTNARTLKLYLANYGSYPTALDGNRCPSLPSADTRYCIKLSSDNTFDSYTGTSNTFLLVIKNGTTKYQISEGSSPIAYVAPAITFAKAYGGTNQDSGSSIVELSDGGFAVTGYTISYGAGSWDGFLSKYASDGTLTWTKVFGGAGSDQPTSLIQTNDGSYVVTGYTGSYGNGGSYDTFIAKFSSEGSLSWFKTWGGANDDFASSVVQTNDNGYAVALQTTSFNSDYYDVVILKYDSNGTLSWSKMVPGDYYEVNSRLTVLNDGSLVVGGNTDSYAGGNDIFLVKLTSDGTMSWFKTWGGSGTENLTSITNTSDGGFIITGSSNSFTGVYDAIFLKYGSDGSLSWSKDIAGNVGSISQLADGTYMAGGYSSSFGAGGSDVMISKLGSDGSLSWSKTFGGTLSDSVSKLVLTDDGGFAATGATTSYGVGSYDVLLLKYNSASTINGCSSPMCQTVSPTVSAANGTARTYSPVLINPTASVGSYSLTLSSPTMTTTTIVAVQ